MPQVADYADLAERLASNGSGLCFVNLAQFCSDWVSDPSSVKIRRELDDALLQRAMSTSRPIRIRRMLLYDLPNRREAGAPIEAHRAWVDRLRRDLFFLRPLFAVRASCQGTTPLIPGTYCIRQLVLPAQEPPPRDVLAVGAGSAEFETHWSHVGTLALDANKAKPVGEEDPLWHVDFDVYETARLR